MREGAERGHSPGPRQPCALRGVLHCALAAVKLTCPEDRLLFPIFLPCVGMTCVWGHHQPRAAATSGRMGKAHPHRVTRGVGGVEDPAPLGSPSAVSRQHQGPGGEVGCQFQSKQAPGSPGSTATFSSRWETGNLEFLPGPARLAVKTRRDGGFLDLSGKTWDLHPKRRLHLSERKDVFWTGDETAHGPGSPLLKSLV